MVERDVGRSGRGREAKVGIQSQESAEEGDEPGREEDGGLRERVAASPRSPGIKHCPGELAAGTGAGRGEVMCDVRPRSILTSRCKQVKRGGSSL